MSKPAGIQEKTVTEGSAIIYYLPYKPSYKDKLYARFGNNKFTLIRKAFSFAELFFQNFFLRVLPFYNFYTKAVQLFEENPDLCKVVITANPFVAFFIGYKLKKKYPRVKWVADYRDDWNTTELITKRNFLERILFYLESASEKKWVGTATAITTISGYYLQKISAFTAVKGHVLLNGYSDDDGPAIKSTGQSNELAITYNGTLYASQPIEIFLQGFKDAYVKLSGRLPLKLFFPGLAFDPSQAKRVLDFMKGHEQALEITERVPRSKVFEIQNRSHAFLMIAHKDIKGIPSSKLYEYLNFRKPVLLCPNDNDIIEQTLLDSGLGIICNSAAEVQEQIVKMAEVIIEKGKLNTTVNEDKLLNYSRRNQAKVLAEILNSL